MVCGRLGDLSLSSRATWLILQTPDSAATVHVCVFISTVCVAAHCRIGRWYWLQTKRIRHWPYGMFCSLSQRGMLLRHGRVESTATVPICMYTVGYYGLHVLSVMYEVISISSNLNSLGYNNFLGSQSVLGYVFLGFVYAFSPSRFCYCLHSLHSK